MISENILMDSESLQKKGFLENIIQKKKFLWQESAITRA